MTTPATKLENEAADDKGADDRTKLAVTPRKTWKKPVVKRIFQGLGMTASGGAEGPGGESSTYTHIS